MRIDRLFTEHPASVGETYWQHFGMALSFSATLFAAAFCCLVHAIFPFAFEKTGSCMITRLHDRMVTNRSRLEKQSAAMATQPAEKSA